MDARARTALQGSIEHWQRLAACESRGAIDAEGTGPGSCALCREFNRSHDPSENCIGCPVFERTKAHGCGGTPYDDCDDYLDQVDEDEIEFNFMHWREHATAELEFLQSLMED